MQFLSLIFINISMYLAFDTGQSDSPVSGYKEGTPPPPPLIH